MIKRIIIAVLVLCASVKSFAQSGGNTLRTFRVGIFSPLYLDSVFSDNGYKYGKGFPKFIQQGLDFVQGAQIALDSMPLPNGNIRATIYDSKAEEENIAWLIENHKLDTLDLLIGAVKDAEFSQLAAFAKKRNIPFISATLPNDGGVTSNPFLVIVNSTLHAHCENIYSYLLQNHGSDKIILCRKKGSQEDKIAEYFRTLNQPDGKPLLNIQTVNIEDDFSILKSKLDSTKKNVIVGASLNEEFADNLVSTLYGLKKTYPFEVVGMPNWDGFADIRKATYKDFPVLYTTPYLNAKTDSYSKKIQACYLKKYKGIPSDITYKGYETVFVFSRLITRYPDDFMSHLNDYSYKVFSEYNFKPVYVSKKSGVPDYFENKHLYFMKIMNGKVTKAW